MQYRCRVMFSKFTGNCMYEGKASRRKSCFVSNSNFSGWMGTVMKSPLIYKSMSVLLSKSVCLFLCRYLNCNIVKDILLNYGSIKCNSDGLFPPPPPPPDNEVRDNFFVGNPLPSETPICLINTRGRGGALSGGFLLPH